MPAKQQDRQKRKKSAMSSQVTSSHTLCEHAGAVPSTSQASLPVDGDRKQPQQGSGQNCNRAGITPHKALTIYQDEVLITLSHEDSDPWSSEEAATSDEEDSQSDTSTPGYKRGKYRSSPTVTDEDAIVGIRLEGIDLPPVPSWMKKKRRQTLAILCDDYMQ